MLYGIFYIFWYMELWNIWDDWNMIFYVQVCSSMVRHRWMGYILQIWELACTAWINTSPNTPGPPNPASSCAIALGAGQTGHPSSPSAETAAIVGCFQKKSWTSAKGRRLKPMLWCPSGNTRSVRWRRQIKPICRTKRAYIYI